jgi:hypothetical protein
VYSEIHPRFWRTKRNREMQESIIVIAGLLCGAAIFLLLADIFVPDAHEEKTIRLHLNGQ